MDKLKEAREILMSQGLSEFDAKAIVNDRAFNPDEFLVQQKKAASMDSFVSREEDRLQEMYGVSMEDLDDIGAIQEGAIREDGNVVFDESNAGDYLALMNLGIKYGEDITDIWATVQEINATVAEDSDRFMDGRYQAMNPDDFTRPKDVVDAVLSTLLPDAVPTALASKSMALGLSGVGAALMVFGPGVADYSVGGVNIVDIVGTGTAEAQSTRPESAEEFVPNGSCLDGAIRKEMEKNPGEGYIKLTFPHRMSGTYSSRAVAQQFLKSGLSRRERRKDMYAIHNFFADSVLDISQMTLAECEERGEEDSAEAGIARVMAHMVPRSDTMSRYDECRNKVVGSGRHKKLKRIPQSQRAPDKCLDADMTHGRRVPVKGVKDGFRLDIDVAPDDRLERNGVDLARDADLVEERKNSLYIKESGLLAAGADPEKLKKFKRKGSIKLGNGDHVGVSGVESPPPAEPVACVPVPCAPDSSQCDRDSELSDQIGDVTAAVNRNTDAVNNLGDEVGKIGDKLRGLQLRTGENIPFKPGLTGIEDVRAEIVNPYIYRLRNNAEDLTEYRESVQEAVSRLPETVTGALEGRRDYEIYIGQNESATEFDVLLVKDGKIWARQELNGDLARKIRQYLGDEKNVYVTDNYTATDSSHRIRGDLKVQPMFIQMDATLRRYNEDGATHPLLRRPNREADVVKNALEYLLGETPDGNNIAIKLRTEEGREELSKKYGVEFAEEDARAIGAALQLTSEGVEVVAYRKYDGLVLARSTITDENVEEAVKSRLKHKPGAFVDAIVNPISDEAVREHIDDIEDKIADCRGYHRDKTTGRKDYRFNYLTLFQDAQQLLYVYNREGEKVGSMKCDTETQDTLVNNTLVDIISFAHPTKGSIQTGQGMIYAEEILTTIAYIAAIVGGAYAISNAVSGDDGAGNGSINNPGGEGSGNNADPWDQNR